MRLARCEVIDPDAVTVAHVYNRTVRRCFLMGDDPISGENFDHRKVWIEQTLEQFAGLFGIDLIGYAVLSNHFHLILRTRPDVVASWSDEEVARRWLSICPVGKNKDGSAVAPTDKHVRSITGCSLKLAEIRRRLSDIAWWMRLLCQRVATRSNKEDGQTGRFFQDRYKATVLCDEASLLACSLYVDLNLVRAAMAQTIEDSDHTSIQRRVRAERAKIDPEASPRRLTEADFLSPLTVNPDDPIVPDRSKSSHRCSNKGYLSMSVPDYLQLLDWTARQTAQGKRGRTDGSVPPVLRRLGLSSGTFVELTRDFGSLFGHVAGGCERVDAMRSCQTGRRFRLRKRARQLMSGVASD